MRFHEFGIEGNPIIILIHGMLTPWQMWEHQIEQFEKDYFVIVPALDAHIEEEPNEFISSAEEASQIINYVVDHYGANVYMLVGLSLGGVIAYKIFESGRLNINRLVLDGAPLVPITSSKFVNKIVEGFMRRQYISIIQGARKRKKSVLKNFVKHFMPENYLESFLKIADAMSDESISNIVNSACNNSICHSLYKEHTKILFLHGTRANEILSVKAASKIKDTYRNVKIQCFNGYSHGELATYHPEEWCNIVDCFASKQRWDDKI